jgi:hypothetical protein
MLQFGASLTYDTSSVNYDRNMFIIQAIGQIHIPREGHRIVLLSERHGISQKPFLASLECCLTSLKKTPLLTLSKQAGSEENMSIINLCLLSYKQLLPL